MIIGIPSEIKTGEKRVAMSPANVQSLTDKSVTVLVQKNAGSAAGYPDAEYNAAGAATIANREEIFATADIILQVQSFGSNTENSDENQKHCKATTRHVVFPCLNMHGVFMFAFSAKRWFVRYETHLADHSDL